MQDIVIKLNKDGDEWCALIGENIQEGICAFGKTPIDALVGIGDLIEVQYPPPMPKCGNKMCEDGYIFEHVQNKLKRLKRKRKKQLENMSEI
jgi:hypothetical protein